MCLQADFYLKWRSWMFPTLRALRCAQNDSIIPHSPDLPLGIPLHELDVNMPFGGFKLQPFCAKLSSGAILNAARSPCNIPAMKSMILL